MVILVMAMNGQAMLTVKDDKYGEKKEKTLSGIIKRTKNPTKEESQQYHQS